MELEPNDDAKSLGKSCRWEEGVFLSYVHYFLIAIGLSVKLNSNIWTRNGYCSNNSIIKLISPIPQKRAVSLFVFC